VAERLLRQHDAVVLKILSDDISHKSDVGGVKLDLRSRAAVRRAGEEMLAHIGSIRPQARLDGFTLSPMIDRPDSHELLVGMSVDATFGPLIMFGAGGTSVEVVADTSIAIPPLDMRLARDLVSRTRIARLLAGYRDRKPADIDAIARTLVRLSSLVVQHPEIREVDINPLLADDAGVIALDARIRLADDVAGPRTGLVIKPYPAEWVREEVLESVGRLTLRPIRPADENLYERFLEHVTAQDLRLRLFNPVKAFSHKFLARLTQIDYAREMAFVAISEPDGDLVGIARFAADPDYETAEYGVLVRSDLKGKGLGWLMMRRLIDYAQATGLTELNGLVLAENTVMLRMCRELGFSVTTVADEPMLRHVVLPLGRGMGGRLDAG
jgi:acetyltransferase